MDNNNSYIDVEDGATPKKKMSTKKIVILASIGVFILLLIIASIYQSNKQKALDASSVVEESSEEEEPEETLSDEELEQQVLREQLGDPGKGFIWSPDADGTKFAVGDPDASIESVCGKYFSGLRGDLNQAQKYTYANTSSVINSLTSMTNEDRMDNGQDLNGKLFSVVMTSITPVNSPDYPQSLMLPGLKQRVTYLISVKDLSYQEWWMDQSEEIFTHIRNTPSGDDIAIQNYLQTKILEYFRSSKAKTVEIPVDVTLTKLNGGWLICDDKDIEKLCNYTGIGNYEAIMEAYSDWLDQKIDEEERAAES